MDFEIRFSPGATEDLERLPPEQRKRVAKAIEKLGKWPSSEAGDVKRLRGFERKIYRLRTGPYRVVFEAKQKVLVILAILHRRDLRKFLREL